MKRSRKQAALAVSAVLVLSLVIPIASLVVLVQAAVPWTSPPSALSLKDGSLDDELYVQEASIVKTGSTYEMWYTHGQTALSESDIVNSLALILTDDIMTALSNLDLDALLDALSAVDVDALWDFLSAISTVIGYATSTDGINWTVVNSAVLGGGGGAMDSVGAPSIVKTGPGSYEMWYTHTKTPLTKPGLQDILDDLGGDTTARKNAMLALRNATTTVIGYTTSTDGINWDPPDLGVLAGSGAGLLDSVGSPSVIRNSATDYEMWYTQSKTDVTEGDIDTILADIANFDADVLWDVLDGTGSVISYTTSTNGTTWDPPTDVLVGGSGLWDSVGAPSVLNTGGGYEMWYTHGSTDLTSSSIETLFDEIRALESYISALWTSIKSLDLDLFLAAFTELIDNQMGDIKARLADTSNYIGYATSGDGTTWIEQNPEALVGASSSPWASVSNPSVVWQNGVYEMWFTQGIDDLTAQNLVYLLDGTILPLGYATGFNLVAETSSSLDKDTNDIVVIMVNINRGKDSYTDSQADIPGGISAYTAIATWNPAGIELLEVRGESPFDSPSFDSGTGIFSDSSTSPQQPSNSTVAKIVPRLIGDALTSYDLIIAFQNIMANAPSVMNVTEENSNTFTFLRGDATGDGAVTLGDALFALQNYVGLRPLSEINAVNVASVAWDGSSGDKITLGDALFILQYVAELRDANFN